jgi:succinyl-CoA synthetase beta subunit
MNIHEYQAKAILRDFGAPVAVGVPVLKAEDAAAAARQLPGPVYVVKAQIHAGGRGKGKFKESSAGEQGGVRIAKSVDEAAAFAKQMLGATLVTLQTGDAGKQVNRLYIEDGAAIDKEFYLSMLIASPRASPSSFRPKAAWILKKSPMTRPRKSSLSPSIRRPAFSRIMAVISPMRWA